LADQDWIGLMIFKNFADQDWIGFNFIGSGLDSDWKISHSAHLWRPPPGWSRFMTSSRMVFGVWSDWLHQVTLHCFSYRTLAFGVND